MAGGLDYATSDESCDVSVRYAIMRGDTASLQALLPWVQSSGALDRLDDDGRTPLMLALMTRRLNMVQLMVDAGVRVTPLLPMFNGLTSEDARAMQRALCKRKIMEAYQQTHVRVRLAAVMWMMEQDPEVEISFPDVIIEADRSWMLEAMTGFDQQCNGYRRVLARLSQYQ